MQNTSRRHEGKALLVRKGGIRRFNSGLIIAPIQRIPERAEVWGKRTTRWGNDIGQRGGEML